MQHVVQDHGSTDRRWAARLSQAYQHHLHYKHVALVVLTCLSLADSRTLRWVTLSSMHITHGTIKTLCMWVLTCLMAGHAHMRQRLQHGVRL